MAPGRPPRIAGEPVGVAVRWSYDQAVRYLLSRVNYEAISGGRLPPRTPGDLDRFARGLGRLGHPEKQAPAIHVAGTNGKGSTAAVAAAILGALGRTTGLYTSPHLVDMRERIRVNGVPVGRAEFARAIQMAAEFVGGEAGSGFRTTFELLTAGAFLVFCAREVDAQVIEVGLGGRLDSTNVILPKVAVLTSISLDHRDVLGDNLALIAADKAHILKRGGLAISARQVPAVMAALKSRARRVGVTLETLDDLEISEPRPTRHGELFDLKTPYATYEGLVLGLKGVHQVENASLAIRAVELFCGGPLDPALLRKAVRAARWPGRFEVLSTKPPLVIDGAHNPGGADRLVGALDRYFPGRRVTFLFGATKGKDIEAILKTLGPRAASMVIASADHPRAEDPELVATLARRAVSGPVETVRDLRSGLIRARHLADGGVVCAAGSLYLVGDVRRTWPALKASWSGAAPKPRRPRPRRKCRP